MIFAKNESMKKRQRPKSALKSEQDVDTNKKKKEEKLDNDIFGVDNNTNNDNDQVENIFNDDVKEEKQETVINNSNINMFEQNKNEIRKQLVFSSPFQSKRMLFYFNVNDIFV